MRKRRALPTTQARNTIVELAQSGWRVYAIVKFMNERRFKPPRGNAWSKGHVKRVLHETGIEAVTGSKETSPEAVTMILDAGRIGASVGSSFPVIIRDAIDRLEREGLTPAHGGIWRDSVIRRLLEKHLGLTSKKLTDDERFQRSILYDPETGCDIWRGSMQEGRGKFEVNGKLELAYKWNYTREHGDDSIPDGYHLHHTCRRPACVNVGHLVAVSPEEHRKLELEELVINNAARNGTLRTELDELATRDDRDAWPSQPNRVGAMRPGPRKRLAIDRTG
jgi:hypothetical protein